MPGKDQSSQLHDNIILRRLMESISSEETRGILCVMLTCIAQAR
jgi:hypothetical protein